LPGLWPESGVERITMVHEYQSFLEDGGVDFDRLEQPKALPETDWRDPKFAKRVADLVAEAARRRGRGSSQPSSPKLGDREWPTEIAGHPGTVGFAQSHLYGYWLENGGFKAVLQRLPFARRDMRPLSLSCERGAHPACVISLPFEDRAGSLQIRTDGD